MEEAAESESLASLIIKFVKSLGDFVPAAALLSGLLYVFGIAVASTIDWRLGVGNIEVSRERAVSLGFLTLILSVPYARYALNFEAYRDDLKSDIFKDKLKTLFSIGVHPFVYCFAISASFSLAQMHTVASIVIASLLVYILFFSIEILLNLHMVSVLASNTKLFAWIFPFLITGAAAPLLPMAYGGHEGPNVVISLKDRSNLRGQIKVMDGRVIVVEANQKYTAVPREKIESVESVGKVYGLSDAQSPK